MCPFKNLNYIDQHKSNFPVDNLTKLHPKETKKRIIQRHEKLRTCTWLNDKHKLIKVINQPWIPLHETTKYLSEAEVLPDFLPHLTGGIEELKTSAYECNLLTFINEVQQFHELSTTTDPHYETNSNLNSQLILATTHSLSNFMTQISDVHKRFSQQGRHPVGRMGIFHLIDLVKFLAYKWLNKIKYRENEPGRIQLLTWALPTTYNKTKAKNELFSIESKDHITLQSRESIASLLVYWSHLHY